jgi:hypothetical protein
MGYPSLSRFTCHGFIFWCLALWIMVSQTITKDNTSVSSNQNLVQIRKKIKEVFGWDCTMKDDALAKCYSITREGDLIMILR